MLKVRCLVFMLCLLNAATVFAMRSREEMGVKPIQKKPAATKVAPASPAKAAQDQDKPKESKPEDAEPTKDNAPANTPEIGQKKPE